jgi:hypothetical protein
MLPSVIGGPGGFRGAITSAGYILAWLAAPNQNRRQQQCEQNNHQPANRKQ